MAIESAAVLTNCLVQLIQEAKGGIPDLSAIKTSLKRYQGLQKTRAHAIGKSSYDLQRAAVNPSIVLEKISALLMTTIDDLMISK